MEEKIRKVVAGVLKVAPDELADESSPDTITNWDSLQHINLTLALEEEFGIKFTPDEMLDMMNYKLIALIVGEHLGKNK